MQRDMSNINEYKVKETFPMGITKNSQGHYDEVIAKEKETKGDIYSIYAISSMLHESI